MTASSDEQRACCFRPGGCGAMRPRPGWPFDGPSAKIKTRTNGPRCHRQDITAGDAIVKKRPVGDAIAKKKQSAMPSPRRHGRRYHRRAKKRSAMPSPRKNTIGDAIAKKTATSCDAIAGEKRSATPPGKTVSEAIAQKKRSAMPSPSETQAATPSSGNSRRYHRQEKQQPAMPSPRRPGRRFHRRAKNGRRCHRQENKHDWRCHRQGKTVTGGDVIAKVKRPPMPSSRKNGHTMHVCMSVCTHACMYVCLYVCMYAWMYVCVRMCM